MTVNGQEHLPNGHVYMGPCVGRGCGRPLTTRSIREIVALRAQGRPLRAIADAVLAKGVRISHEGVAGVLREHCPHA